GNCLDSFLASVFTIICIAPKRQTPDALPLFMSAVFFFHAVFCREGHYFQADAVFTFAVVDSFWG
ncbi:MAG: hypothetical protein ABIK68_01160, partial [bacterium]